MSLSGLLAKLYIILTMKIDIIFFPWGPEGKKSKRLCTSANFADFYLSPWSVKTMEGKVSKLAWIFKSVKKTAWFIVFTPNFLSNV